MDKKILILGDGLLGSELQRQTGWDYLSRKKDGFIAENILNDFEKWKDIFEKYTDIVNCIAYTNTRNNTKNLHMQINLDFVQDLVYLCNMMGKRLIHISTDYLYSGSVEFAKEEDVLVQPNNWYCFSKLLSDIYVQFTANNFLTIRTTFKKNPYPYERAWNNLIGNFDYVDKIGDIIVKLINNNAKGVYNVGTKTKTLYELAKQTRTDVEIDDTTYHGRPTNTTMNLDKLNKFLLTI